MQNRPLSAPGKVVLCGEYAVLEGATATVCAIQRRAHLRWTETSQEITPEVKACIEIATKALHKSFPPFSVDVAAFKQDDKKLGLGASGASAACAAAALISAKNPTVDLGDVLPDILDLALSAHRAVSPQGSGIDVATSVIGYVLEFQTTTEGPQINFLDASVRIPKLVIWTGKSAQTSAFLESISRVKRSQTEAYQAIIDDMKLVSADFARALKAHEIDTIMERTSDYASLMQALGALAEIPIWTSEMEAITETVHKSDGVTKPSGAGGGDIMIAFFRDEDAKIKCADALKERRFLCVSDELGGPGVQFD
jgi:phosphomevalonate kinase